MPIWYYHVDVSDIFHNDDFTVIAKAHAIGARIRLSDWYEDDNGNELTDLVEELEAITTVDEFDDVWDAIYDRADMDRAWINTVSDHQNETPSLTTRDHD